MACPVMGNRLVMGPLAADSAPCPSYTASAVFSDTFTFYTTGPPQLVAVFLALYSTGSIVSSPSAYGQAQFDSVIGTVTNNNGATVTYSYQSPFGQNQSSCQIGGCFFTTGTPFSITVFEQVTQSEYFNQITQNLVQGTTFINSSLGVSLYPWDPINQRPTGGPLVPFTVVSSASSTPEPGTFLLTVAGFAALLHVGRRRV